MSVRATTHAAAEAIVNQIVSTGIGALVPSSVIITRYSLTSTTRFTELFTGQITISGDNT